MYVHNFILGQSIYVYTVKGLFNFIFSKANKEIFVTSIFKFFCSLLTRASDFHTSYHEMNLDSGQNLYLSFKFIKEGFKIELWAQYYKSVLIFIDSYVSQQKCNQ